MNNRRGSEKSTEQKIFFPYLSEKIDPSHLDFAKNPLSSLDFNNIPLPKLKSDSGITRQKITISNQNETLEFEVYKELGQGQFGGVLLAQNTVTGEWIAIKKLKRKEESNQKEEQKNNGYVNRGQGAEDANQEQAMFRAEAEKYDQMGMLSFYDESQEMIGMKLLPGMSLDKVIHNFNGYGKPIQKLPNAQLLFIAKDMAVKLAHLHKDHEYIRGTRENRVNMIHADIKPENIVLDVSNHSIEYCDYGFVKTIKDFERSALLIMMTNETQKIDDSILQRAREENSPILIKELSGAFKVYGLSEEDTWAFKSITLTEKEEKFVNRLFSEANQTEDKVEEGIKIVTVDLSKKENADASADVADANINASAEASEDISADANINASADVSVNADTKTNRSTNIKININATTLQYILQRGHFDKKPTLIKSYERAGEATFSYLAPELKGVLQGQNPETEASDVHALGWTCAELLGVVKVSGGVVGDKFQLKKGQNPSLPKKAIALIKKMTLSVEKNEEKNYQKRPTAVEVAITLNQIVSKEIKKHPLKAVMVPIEEYIRFNPKQKEEFIKNILKSGIAFVALQGSFEKDQFNYYNIRYELAQKGIISKAPFMVNEPEKEKALQIVKQHYDFAFSTTNTKVYTYRLPDPVLSNKLKSFGEKMINMMMPSSKNKKPRLIRETVSQPQENNLVATNDMNELIQSRSTNIREALKGAMNKIKDGNLDKEKIFHLVIKYGDLYDAKKFILLVLELQDLYLASLKKSRGFLFPEHHIKTAEVIANPNTYPSSYVLGILLNAAYSLTEQLIQKDDKSAINHMPSFPFQKKVMDLGGINESLENGFEVLDFAKGNLPVDAKREHPKH